MTGKREKLYPMPLFWRYLLKAYIRVFLLSVLGFISILLVTRLKEIANYAALGSTLGSTLLFALYQIPHILPIAIPISGLISSILLFQNMSRTHELTALRASGLSLKNILAPILCVAGVLSILNFFVCSELTTRSRLRTMELFYSDTSVNPLLLLHRQKLIKLKSSFFDMKDTQKNREASDVVFIINYRNQEKLGFFCAEKVSIKQNLLIGQNVGMISHLPSQNPDEYDSLIVENQDYLSMDAPTLSRFIKKTNWNLSAASLPLKLLWVHAASSSPTKATEVVGMPVFSVLSNEVLTEVLRRISLGLTAFTLTLIGCCYSLELGRSQQKRNIFWISCLSILVLSSYMFGKKMNAGFLVAVLVYFLPHTLTSAIALFNLQRFSRGKE